MFIRGIGEVEFVWKKVPVGGYFLRESNGVVLLEEYLDEEGKSVDVVHQFDEEYTLTDKISFSECLAEARRYVGDFNIPIYVQTPSERRKEEEAEKERQKSELAAVVENCGRRPWKGIMNLK